MVERSFVKDPCAVLDYAFNWNDPDRGPWLQTGETIISQIITVDSGLTKDRDNESDGVVTVWLSGGTARESYLVACQIKTNLGRTEERTILISVDER